jgi:hypothetical protein
MGAAGSMPSASGNGILIPVLFVSKIKWKKMLRK